MITNPIWYKGLAFSERLQALKARGGTLPRLTQGASVVADRRMQRWLAQEPFGEDEIFARRLAMDALDAEEFRSLLAGEVETLVEDAPLSPVWIDTLEQAFSARERSTQTYACTEQGNQAFLAAFAPMIAQHRAQLLTSIEMLKQNYPSAPFVPQDIENVCWNNHVQSLTNIVMRTMVLELQVARLQGLLHGETSEERFQSFIQHISQEHVSLALLQEYPVLARTLTASLTCWVEASLELLTRLCTDWEAIRDTFSEGEDPGVLVKIKASGDRHRRGRAVALLDFATGFRLVYKPKSLDADENFQALLVWLNEHGQQPELRPTRILNRGTYGWCEFLEHQPCSSVEEVTRFYQREGGLLALLYLLAATDFHYENIIAVGEHPMLVDYESLFHPAIRPTTPDETPAMDDALAETVFSVGLLPRRTWSTDEFAGVNLSGLGGDYEQISPHAGAIWADEGTDEVHLGRERRPIAGGIGHNLPVLAGKQVGVLGYKEAFLEGFTTTYRILWQERAQLLAENGPLTCFVENELRLLVRPTHIYSLMLRESSHPDLLRDGLERDRFFEKLWKPAKLAPMLPLFIPFERADLWNGDFPIFFVRPASHHIWSSAGECIQDVLTQSGWERVQARLQRLGEADLQWQCWVIHASLTALMMNTAETYARKEYPLPVIAAISQNNIGAEALKAARAVGDRLGELAQRSGSVASWIGLRAFQEEYWDVALLDLKLYSGLPGVALFLAYLGQVTGEDRYTTLAKEALANMHLQLAELPMPLHSLGAFDGYGGLIYTLTHLAALWHSSELLDEAETLVEKVFTLLEKNPKFDIIDGLAGCIGGLLCLYEHRPTERVLKALTQCGHALLQGAQKCATGIGWVTPLSSQPLAGFSHGSAGIAWALLRLAEVTQIPQFGVAAQAAIAYERSLFSKKHHNWSDLRTEDTSSFMTAWCHGATGIGLARLATLSHLDTGEVRDELAQAIETTLATGFGHNHSLCHGDLGNLEFLSLAAQALGDKALQVQTEILTTRLLASIEQYGWLCGAPQQVENPGLMVGLAGIGLALLRLAHPTIVPSVLILEHPKQC